MAKSDKAAATKTVSKKDQAIKIVKRMDGRKNPASRGDIIKELVAKVGLSSNGAATYLQNIRSGKAGWV